MSADNADEVLDCPGPRARPGIRWRTDRSPSLSWAARGPILRDPHRTQQECPCLPPRRASHRPAPTAGRARTRSTPTASRIPVRSAGTIRTITCSARSGGRSSSAAPAFPHADTVLGTESERLASMAMVADGVGGAAKGETASRVALTGITRYVSRSLRCYYRSEEDEDFSEALQTGRPRVPRGAPPLAEEDSDHRGMATTLTLYLACGPGPTCCRWGQPLLPAARRRADPDHPRPDDGPGDGGPRRHEAGAGGRHPAGAHPHQLDRRLPDRPTVTRFDMAWGHVLLLCSDGLTRHVSDDRIRECCAR